MGRSTPPDGEFHTPVMVDDVVELLSPVAPGVVVDATFGGGGHSAALLTASPELRILAIDRDPAAIERVPVDTRVQLVTANFGDLAQVLDQPEVRSWIDESPHHRQDRRGLVGVLFDLGVSSRQLDRADRGFSYHWTGPLDMRMGPDAVRTAADVVNGWDAARLTDIFRRFGEERYARRIADRIVADRPFADTTTLAESIAAAVPAPARRHGHPARRVFQAIRIAVNDELTAVVDGLDAAIAAVDTGGRIVTIAYHSLEDRIVKRRFREGSQGCICPPELPVCVCDNSAELRRLTRKPRRPGAAEVAANPRARSARLRAAEKMGPGGVSRAGRVENDAAGGDGP